jgi:hypothetical protein
MSSEFRVGERCVNLVAAILSQPVGHRPDKPDYMYESGRDVWAKEFLERRLRGSGASAFAGKYCVAMNSGSSVIASPSSTVGNNASTLVPLSGLVGVGSVGVTQAPMSTQGR